MSILTKLPSLSHVSKLGSSAHPQRERVDDATLARTVWPDDEVKPRTRLEFNRRIGHKIVQLDPDDRSSLKSWAFPLSDDDMLQK